MEERRDACVSAPAVKAVAYVVRPIRVRAEVRNSDIPSTFISIPKITTRVIATRSIRGPGHILNTVMPESSLLGSGFVIGGDSS